MTVSGSGEVRIGASGAWRGLLLAAVLLAASVTLIRFGGLVQLYGICVTAATAVVIGYTIIFRRHDGLACDDSGLVVTVRGRRTVHEWDGLLEVGWISAGWPYHGAGVLTRPADGGPWDTPGPNNPTQIATFAVFGRDAHRRARAVLREQCAHHQVPFAENGRRMLMDGPPGSPYRRTR